MEITRGSPDVVGTVLLTTIVDVDREGVDRFVVPIRFMILLQMRNSQRDI